MTGIVFLWIVAVAVAFICLIPRPNHWAEQAGLRLKAWIDERIERK